MDGLNLLKAIYDRNEENTKAKQIKAPSSDTITSFPLLDLPPEIWSRICHYAITPEVPTVYLTLTDDPLHWQKCLAQPSVMRTCRAIRAECDAAYYADLLVLYRYGWPSSTLRKWLEAIGASNRKHVAIYDFDSVLDRSEGAKFGFVTGSQFLAKCVEGWVRF